MSTLIRTNKVIKESQATQDFMLHYCHSLEVNRPEVMAVTDSALGNDNSQGPTELDKMLKVHCTARVDAMQSSWPSGDDG